LGVTVEVVVFRRYLLTTTSDMKYARLVQFKDDEYDVATATAVEEVKQLLKAGLTM
jgi:hypothetical protein